MVGQLVFLMHGYLVQKLMLEDEVIELTPICCSSSSMPQ